MEFKTPKPNRELPPVSDDAWSRALDAAREDLVAAKKELESSRELLEHPERKLYAALEGANQCREKHGRICDPCWKKVSFALKTLRSVRP